MKKAVALVLAAIMALSMAACGSDTGAAATEAAPAATEAATEAAKETEAAVTEAAAAEGKKLVFGFMPYYRKDDFYKDLENAAILRAEELGVEIDVQDPDGDTQKGLAILEAFVANKVDAITCCPLGQEAGLPYYQQCKDNGVPVVTFDGMVDEGANQGTDAQVVTCALQFDFADCGVQLGNFIKDYVTEHGQWNGTDKLRTVIIEFAASATVGVPLIDSAQKVLEDAGVIEVLAKQDGKANRNDALAVMENILPSIDYDVDLIIGFNYDACMGAVTACEQAGMTDKDCVAFSQLWGEEAFIQMDEGTHIWKGGVAYSPTTYGEQAVQMCYDFITGKEVPKVQFLEPMCLSHENLNETLDWKAVLAARK